jgi:hypothetical protein
MFGRLFDVGGWLLLVFVLTFALYLPIWFAIGAWLYPHAHPDYWVWATPRHILPISGLISLGIVSLATWAWKRFA